MIEIRENGGFRKITQRRIHRIKNHSIWISIRGESKSEVERNFQKFGRTKTEIKDEIKGKTHILTRDSDQNDPINRRIQGFSFCDFENDHRCQETNSS